MLVLAPASHISRLDWWTNAEDDARTDAAERADELAAAVPTDDVESRVGDSDPVTAIEDALRSFPADELIVVTLPDEDAAWLERERGGRPESLLPARQTPRRRQRLGDRVPPGRAGAGDASSRGDRAPEALRPTRARRLAVGRRARPGRAVQRDRVANFAHSQARPILRAAVRLPAALLV